MTIVGPLGGGGNIPQTSAAPKVTILPNLPVSQSSHSWSVWQRHLVLDWTWRIATWQITTMTHTSNKTTWTKTWIHSLHYICVIYLILWSHHTPPISIIPGITRVPTHLQNTQVPTTKPPGFGTEGLYPPKTYNSSVNLPGCFSSIKHRFGRKIHALWLLECFYLVFFGNPHVNTVGAIRPQLSRE